MTPTVELMTLRDDPSIMEYMTIIINAYCERHKDSKSLIKCIIGEAVCYRCNPHQIMKVFRSTENPFVIRAIAKELTGIEDGNAACRELLGHAEMHRVSKGRWNRLAGI